MLIWQFLAAGAVGLQANVDRSIRVQGPDSPSQGDFLEDPSGRDLLRTGLTEPIMQNKAISLIELKAAGASQHSSIVSQTSMVYERVKAFGAESSATNLLIALGAVVVATIVAVIVLFTVMDTGDDRKKKNSARSGGSRGGNSGRTAPAARAGGVVTEQLPQDVPLQQDPSRGNSQESALTPVRESTGGPPTLQANTPFVGSSPCRTPQAFGSGSPSTESTGTSYSGSEDGLPLATGLVVNNIDGFVVTIPWELSPQPQDTVVVVRDHQSKNTVANAFVSERGPDPGILLETAQRDTFAFLDTSRALVGYGSNAQTNRRVILRKASVGGWDVAGPPYAVLFINTNAGGSTLQVRRGGLQGNIGRSVMVLHLDPAGQVVKAVCSNTNRVLAEAVPAPPVSGSLSPPSARSSFLKMSHGTDAGLVLCAVFAAQKLC
jgi:hypothetical protein